MSFSKQKGTAFETEIVNAHKKLGVSAKRQPLSGAMDEYPCDVQISGLYGECKRRRKGFSSLYKAIEQGKQPADVLFVRDDHQKTLVVLPWQTWVKFLEWANIK